MVAILRIGSLSLVASGQQVVGPAEWFPELAHR